jgi:hypothetical protein
MYYGLRLFSSFELDLNIFEVWIEHFNISLLAVEEIGFCIDCAMGHPDIDNLLIYPVSLVC